MPVDSPRSACVSFYRAGYDSRHGGRVACCIDALVEGAISTADLCPACASWLRAVLDQAAGYALPWRDRGPVEVG